MGLSRAALVVALAGCFRPAPEAGAPCADNGSCPEGLACIGNRCLPPGSSLDDALIATDADLDAPGPPIDALLAWSMPVAIPGVNTTGNETDPTLSSDRLTIVFGRDQDLYIGTRADVTQAFTVAPLTALNTPNRDQSPELSADGNTLWFTSEVAAVGDADVYVSVRGGGSFTTKTRVDQLSTVGTPEGDIGVSPDGLTCVVSRAGTFMRATRANTGALWGAPASLGAIFGTSPASPSLTANGDLYFHADATRNLYVARKQGTTFAAPTAITELNTATRDAAPFVSANERFLWIEHDGELYESQR